MAPTGFTDGQRSEIERSDELNESVYKAATSRLYKELADQYQSYADKRLEIERRHNEDIEGLRQGRLQAEAAGDEAAMAVYDRSIAEAVKSRGRELANHDFEVLRRSPEYVRAFEDLRDTSTETLQELLKQFEKSQERGFLRARPAGPSRIHRHHPLSDGGD